MTQERNNSFLATNSVNLNLFDAGFPLVKLNGKRPTETNWPNLHPSRDAVASWGDSNVGIVASGFPGLDCDVSRADVSGAIRSALIPPLATRGVVLERYGRRGFVIPCRLSDGAEPFHKMTIGLRYPDGQPDEKVEVLGLANQWVGNGEHPDTKASYVWTNGTRSGDASLLAEVGPLALPGIDAAWVRDVLFPVVREAVQPFGIVATFGESVARADVAQPSLLCPFGVHSVVAIIDDMDNVIESRAEWVAFASAIKGAVGPAGDAEGEAAWCRWNEKYCGVHRDNGDSDYLANQYRSVRRPVSKGWRELLDFARAGGAEVAAYELEAIPGLAPAEPPPRPHNLTDSGNAKRFADRHRDKAIYVPAWKCWLVWDERRWKKDDTRAVDRLLHETAQSIYGEAERAFDSSERAALAKHAMRTESDGQLRAMRNQAESLLAVRPTEFDRDGMLLNVLNGTIELRTGTLRPHSRTDLITKLAPVTFDPSATCPRFLTFLNEITLDRAELVEFLQIAFGYTLTGDVSEQVFFYLHGRGQNGKSKLLDLFKSILGEYGVASQMSTFVTHRNSGGPRNDVAGLAGFRYVTAIEAGQGQQLDEPLVKQLTGSDTIAERRLFQEAEEFRPSFKLWLSANDHPRIKGTDEGIWRRIRQVPFDYIVPADKRDPALGEKLLSEASGVLTWALAGLAKWRVSRLPHPKAVADATAEYRTLSDTLGAFLDESCERAPAYSVPFTDLYAAYRSWCGRTNEKAETQRDFGRALSDRGFEVKRTSSANRRAGLQLRAADSPFDPIALDILAGASALAVADVVGAV